MVLIKKIAELYRRHWLILSLMIGLIILRAALLTFTPPGFYLDEAASGAHVVSMLHNGSNAHGETWPLFSASLGGGYTTPIYLYPLIVWAFFFGASEYSLRAFSLFATVVAAAFISFTVRIWLGNRAALIAGVTSLVLPWGWVQGSLAWDPALVPTFVAASLLCVSVALTTTSARSRVVAASLSGLSLIALAYLYPPCRVTAPLLLALYYGVLVYQKKLSFKFLLVAAVVFTLLCIPLLQFMFQPDALERSGELSVFHDTTILHGLWQVVVNFLQMLSPAFLFGTGDSNLRHSTGYQGMLGLAAIPMLAAVVYAGIRLLYQYKNTSRQPFTNLQLLGMLSMLGITFSLLGSALTAEGQPHSLRATAAWPFFAILITLGWMYMRVRLPRALYMLLMTFATAATVVYIYDLAAHYPPRSAEAFDVSSRQLIKDGQQPADYPSLSIYYYAHQ